MTIYTVTIETKHGTDSLLVKTEPTIKDLEQIENYFRKAYGVNDVYALNSHSIHIKDIPQSITHFIKNNND